MIRGMTLDTVEEPSEEAMARLAGLGVDHITLIPFGFQRRHNDPNLSFNPEPGWYSEGTTAARELAVLGDSMGFEIVLKPQIWLGHDDDAWSATIGFDTEAEWQAWEANYRTFILHHAQAAEEIASPLFVVGTELGNAVSERPAFWRTLIAEIRTVYSGALTYAANWHDDYEQVPFWDVLDYVGVQAYFPLAEPGGTANHSVEQLRAAWAPHKAALKQVAEQTGKPILFTEIGYRSVPSAAAEPWKWPSRGETTQADTTLQRQLYEAFFTSFWEEDWFAGALVWKWSIRPENRHWRRDGTSIGFSLEGKPAEDVLAEWYGR